MLLLAHYTQHATYFTLAGCVVLAEVYRVDHDGASPVGQEQQQYEHLPDSPL